MSKVDDRRKKLREDLTLAAERRIIDGGTQSVKARDLAKEVGCALGAIYTVFADMNDLIMAVNLRTFVKVDAAVSGSVDGRENDPPLDRLMAMSIAYMHFARDHTNIWRALFSLEMSAELTAPDWYVSELRDLFNHIAKPLSELFPELSAEDRDLLVRGLFSSVHGIILLGLERRISGVSPEQIEAMIYQILARVAGKI
ncbi:MAG: TetR/AcrR family transcriptional regulator [Deltaproteobacteria bacterium]